MSYIIGNIPYFGCYVRREYTRNLKDRHGEYIPAIAYALRCVRAHSLWFQCMLMNPDDREAVNDTGGASFWLPIQALCDNPCEHPKDMTYVQPWDCFGSDFGVAELQFTKRGRMHIIPEKRLAEYLFTIDFTNTDLADDPEQHKSLHVCKMEQGPIAAYPNNRVIWEDSAFWRMAEQKPDFVSLAPEFRAEGLEMPGAGGEPYDLTVEMAKAMAKEAGKQFATDQAQKPNGAPSNGS